MNLRTMTCDIKNCLSSYTEKKPGDGFPGWGQLNGICLDGNDNPCLCPDHLTRMAEYADKLGGSE